MQTELRKRKRSFSPSKLTNMWRSCEGISSFIHVITFVIFVFGVEGFVERYHQQLPFLERSSYIDSIGRVEKQVDVPDYMESKLSATSSSNSPAIDRQDKVKSLMEWSKAKANIQMDSSGVQLTTTDNAGLGYVATDNLDSGKLLVQVPLDVALTVEIPGDGPNDGGNLRRRCRESKELDFKELPWYVQFSLYLHVLNEENNSESKTSIDRSAWLESLPKSFDTPIHWTENQRQERLQYTAMVESIRRQESLWKSWYLQIEKSGIFPSLSWEKFVWGCETARSRAFSGSTAGRFNPGIYAFTLFLVAVYVGLGLGTLEQAANGAGVVFSATVLKDFVLPKLFKKKQYVICPVIDMANHDSIDFNAQVSLEYFANCYSLATTQSVAKGSAVSISYGGRSNDQLLQYYGFVEQNNPFDVYIMPPLRDWPLQAMEEATGRKVASGRLEKLNRAGLLGTSPRDGNDIKPTLEDKADEGVGEYSNPLGGVVVDRVDGIDTAVIQALRALFSTDNEWNAAGEAIGNFASAVSTDNERAVLLAAKTAFELELNSKPTTMDDDERLLEDLNRRQESNVDETLAVLFRIEKKKLLMETIEKLRI